jgi:hypothetical protein
MTNCYENHPVFLILKSWGKIFDLRNNLPGTILSRKFCMSRFLFPPKKNKNYLTFWGLPIINIEEVIKNDRSDN